MTLPRVTHRDEAWSMDFIFDYLATNQKLKCLTIVDQFTKEAPDLFAGISIKGKDVVTVLENLRLSGRKPKTLSIDNGPEFRSRDLQAWATKNHVHLHFIEPGRPTQNAFIESFNSRFREECLNRNLFENLDCARLFISAWKREYEERRPHSSLGGKTPKEFVESLAA